MSRFPLLTLINWVIFLWNKFYILSVLSLEVTIIYDTELV